jgi:hypothetical protein
MSTRRYTFVTVAHAEDYGQLQLQAKSMALYAGLDLVKEIIVVENFVPGTEIDWRANLLTLYGPLASLVRFVTAPDDMPQVAGWWRQQILKLRIAHEVHTDRYVALDAKNVMIAPLTRDFLEDPVSGRPLINGYSFLDHPLYDALERVLTYFRLDPVAYVSQFPRTSTPFTFLTAKVRELIAVIEAREERPLAHTIIDQQLTEFFLYSGYMISRGEMYRSYVMTQPHVAQIWGADANAAGVVEAIEKFHRGKAPFMAVHRQALKRMNRNGRLALAFFLHLRGLFHSLEEAEAFLRDPNAA